MTDPAQAFLNHGNVDNSSSRFGGVSHYEWVFARPWDGVDPSITVGSEVTTLTTGSIGMFSTKLRSDLPAATTIAKMRTALTEALDELDAARGS